jgi:ATP-dependent exoDNAse (exonuclease V) beta subunit
MCVEAGAGTGKTTVLVDRIVHTLRVTDTDVRRIAVITFTEKAAAELAARLRRVLEDAAREASDPAEARRLDEALRGLSHTHIETIHAFAASLLRERPVEAGLDPGFQVLDVLPARLEFEDAYREWLAAAMASDSPPAPLVEALNLGLSLERVREAAEQLHRHRELLPLRPYVRAEIDPESVLDSLAPHITELRRRAGCAIDEEDDAYAELQRMVAWYDDTCARHRGSALRRALVMVGVPKHGRGHQRNWRRASDCRDAKQALDSIKAILDEAKDLMRQNAVADLVLWLQEFVNAYARRRRDAGLADFDDLLIWARDLVRDAPEVRIYFQSKYRRIFVDEFQDTDPLQAELIISLCAEEPLPQDWRRARLRPGSLFVVGDPKQSIYRFRRADIAMYDDVKRHVFVDAPVHIRQNFRSARPIIDWVNDVFAKLFDPAEGVQPPYVDLAFRPDYQVTHAVSTLRGAPPPVKGKRKIDEVRAFEAAKLASLIRANIASDSWRVRTPDGCDRPARYRDVVVLIPNRTKLDIYEEQFALSGVPYRHEGGRTFFIRQEVRESVALLRAIDDPSDGVAAIAALRSSAFGCSDDELLLHKHNGGSFDYTRLRSDAAGAVADALRTLRELAEMRFMVPLPELVRAAIDRGRLVEFALLQPQGDQVAANLLKLIDQARTFSEASRRGLRGFVRWLKDNIDRQSDETDAAISEETDDVVRIMTIHAAKGLEFPIVVFANMAGERRDATTTVADHTAQALHIQLGRKNDGFRTPGFAAAIAGEQLHTSAEDVRLLYVAATRARDRLVVSLISAEDTDAANAEAKSLADRLRMAGAHRLADVDLDALPLPAGEPPIWRAAVDDSARQADVREIVATREAWQRERATLVERAGKPLRALTASALKQGDSDGDASRFAADAVRRVRAAEFGTAVHALLERSLLNTGRLEALVDAIAYENGLHDRREEMLAVARRALEADVLKRALSSPRVLLETPFTLALPDVEGLAEGRIDAMFEEAGGLVIVDFKTDAITLRDVDDRAQSYRTQALVYAWSAHRATGLPVREVVFLFARPDPAVERAFAVDEAFLKEAQALLVEAA